MRSRCRASQNYSSLEQFLPSIRSDAASPAQGRPPPSSRPKPPEPHHRFQLPKQIRSQILHTPAGRALGRTGHGPARAVAGSQSVVRMRKYFRALSGEYVFHRIAPISSKQNKKLQRQKEIRNDWGRKKKKKTRTPPQKTPSVTKFSENKKVPKIPEAYVVWTSRGQGGKTYTNKKKLN